MTAVASGNLASEGLRSGSAAGGANGRRLDSSSAATVALSAAARTVAGVQMMAEAGLMHSRANSSAAAANGTARSWTPSSRHVPTASTSTTTVNDPTPPQRSGVGNGAAASGGGATTGVGYSGSGGGGGVTVGGTVEQSLQPNQRRWGVGEAGVPGPWSGHVPPAPSTGPPAQTGERGVGDRQLTSEHVEAAQSAGGGGSADVPSSREGERERERERDITRALGRQQLGPPPPHTPRLSVSQRRMTAMGGGGGASGPRPEGETRRNEDGHREEDRNREGFLAEHRSREERRSRDEHRTGTLDPSAPAPYLVTAARDAARSAAAAAVAAGLSAEALGRDASVRVPCAAPDSEMIEGGYLLAAPGCESSGGGAWDRLWCLKSSFDASFDARLESVDPGSGFGDLHDGQWKVLVLQSHRLQGTLHLMGTRRGCNKCRCDLAEVLVYDSVLPEEEVHQVATHLKCKYRIDPPDPPPAPDEKISKSLLVRRLCSMPQAAGASVRLDIPKWLERYGLCFEVVETIAQGRPLPRWFSAEIEPPAHELARESPHRTSSSTSSPPLSSLLPPPALSEGGAAGGDAVPRMPPIIRHGPRMMQTVEALFDRNRCGSNATLDVQRTRVEFSGMATVLLTSPVPPEGVHVMQFEVHGRDQCLVGIASPDCDVETYLGHRRGGYGFFAAEGTLKIDGDWKGGHGLSKFKRGDRVGVHVDMSRRTLQFSLSRCVPLPSPEAPAAVYIYIYIYYIM